VTVIRLRKMDTTREPNVSTLLDTRGSGTTLTTAQQQRLIGVLRIAWVALLAGVIPFDGSVGAIVFAHLQQPSPDPRTIVADLPSGVAAAVKKHWRKNCTRAMPAPVRSPLSCAPHSSSERPKYPAYPPGSSRPIRWTTSQRTRRSNRFAYPVGIWRAASVCFNIISRTWRSIEQRQ